MEKILLEVCCGSLEDALCACAHGADRIELNSALYLGGLTPSLGSLRLAKQSCAVPVIAMVRPRGCGFCYSPIEVEAMFADAEILLRNGADGLAFGFLREDRRIDAALTEKMVRLIHSYGKEAVFHRAFDVLNDQEAGIQTLISLGVDRVLTSGGKATAEAGMNRIRALQETYGKQIAILAGCGIHAGNVGKIQEHTQVMQVHSSCRGWQEDATSSNGSVDYSYASGSGQYEAVSAQKASAMKDAIELRNAFLSCRNP